MDRDTDTPASRSGAGIGLLVVAVLLAFAIGSALAARGALADTPSTNHDPPASDNNSTPDPDPDRDGIPIGEDKCPGVHSGNNSDRDNDGVGDVCDDSDGDGPVDAEDECPTVPNPCPGATTPPPSGGGSADPQAAQAALQAQQAAAAATRTRQLAAINDALTTYRAKVAQAQALLKHAKKDYYSRWDKHPDGSYPTPEEFRISERGREGMEQAESLIHLAGLQLFQRMAEILSWGARSSRARAALSAGEESRRDAADVRLLKAKAAEILARRSFRRARLRALRLARVAKAGLRQLRGLARQRPAAGTMRRALRRQQVRLSLERRAQRRLVSLAQRVVSAQLARRRATALAMFEYAF